MGRSGNERKMERWKISIIEWRLDRRIDIKKEIAESEIEISEDEGAGTSSPITRKGRG